jgi:hypothetical protein
MRDVVDDYLMIGNSSTDNSSGFASLQADIDAGLCGDIFFPRNRSTNGTLVSTGAYKVVAANPLVVKNDYTRLVFEPGARINWQPTGPGIGVKYEKPSGTLENCGYENLEIRAPDTVDGQVGVYVHDARYCDFMKYTAAGFAGVASTALKVAGRDHLRFYGSYLQATRPLWLALNDREPTENGKDIDHSSFLNGYLRPLAPPDPGVYFDPGYVLRNSGLAGFAFAGGILQWIDGATVPRRESINFYMRDMRWEQLADLGPVTSALFVIDIQKHADMLLADCELSNLMLSPAAGNDWSGYRGVGVSRTSMRHVVYRGGGQATAGNGTIQTIQCSLEGL